MEKIHMTGSPSLITRAMFGALRGLLAAVALLLGLAVGGFALIPFTIFVLPLPLILAGLLVLYVLGSTQGMAETWHSRRHRARPAATSLEQPDPAWSTHARERPRTARSEVVQR